jgi:hypothetical protein
MRPYKAILTRYLRPNGKRGSRVVAFVDGVRKTLPWDNALSVEENHQAAALALIRHLRWHGRYAAGVLPIRVGFTVWVPLDNAEERGIVLEVPDDTAGPSGT